MSEKQPRRVYWVSGNDFVAKQTQDIMNEFKRSKPLPRWWVMGFMKIAKPTRKKVEL